MKTSTSLHYLAISSSAENKGLLENNVQRQAYLRWKKLSLKQFQITSARLNPRYLQRSEGSAFAQYKYKHLGLPLQVIFFYK